MAVDALGITTEQCIAALEAAGGIPLLAAMTLGCSSSHLRARIAEEPAIKLAQFNVKEDKKDLAEAKLLEGVQHGVPQLVTFFLLQCAQDRGYKKASYGVDTPAPAGPDVDRPSAALAAARNFSPDQLNELKRSLFAGAEPPPGGTDA